ncbi:MAG: ABC transporter substrate-binding protein [Chloroflexi bacterium]|nr:ABC transporter substrate-binding protein [Chloroflexota bacterium]
MEKTTARGLKRREFLRLGAAASALGLLQACSPAAQPAPTTAPKPAETAKPAAQATAAPAATTAPAATQAPATPKPTAGPKKGGTLTVAQTDGLTTFNPFERRWERMRRALYNGLAKYDDKLNLVPELAEKWTFAPDGKSVTFNLRQGVKYHSGREFTSADAKFSIEYAASDVRTLQRPMYQMVKQVETPDKYTVTFKMATPNAVIYDLIDTMAIIDKETIQDAAKTGIGTGPFKLDTYIPNDRVEFVANKDYWDKGKPYLDRYISRIIPDVSAMTVNLESGAVDCIWRINYHDAIRLRETGGKFVVNTGPKGYSPFDIGMNTKLKPFTDKRVRQAVAHCIDRERFAKTVMQGLVEPSAMIWPPQSWAYFKDMEGKRAYDLDKAKALLKEAGLEQGFETEILTASKRQFGYGELAVMLQADLKKVGINAKVSDVEVAQYDARTQKGDIAILAHQYGRANRDPSATMSAAKAWFTEKNAGWTHFESETYEKLQAQLESTLERDKRVPIARQIQELVLEECFTIPVAEGPQVWAYAGYVKGFGFDLDNSIEIGGIWLDK